MRKKIIIALILIIPIVLNPSLNQFKEFTGVNGAGSNLLKRKANFLLFSIYEYEGEYSTERYLGVCMNFIDISKNEPEIFHIDSTAGAVADSTATTLDSVTTQHHENLDNIPPFMEEDTDTATSPLLTKDGLPIPNKKKKPTAKEILEEFHKQNSKQKH
jgi:hypothetical protein